MTKKGLDDQNNDNNQPDKLMLCSKQNYGPIPASPKPQDRVCVEQGDGYCNRRHAPASLSQRSAARKAGE